MRSSACLESGSKEANDMWNKMINGLRDLPEPQKTLVALLIAAAGIAAEVAVMTADIWMGDGPNEMAD